jgi:hypothetical protein
MNKRMLRLLLASYLVKTAVIAAAWLLVPELPRRAMDGAQGLWQAIAGSARP